MTSFKNFGRNLKWIWIGSGILRRGSECQGWVRGRVKRWRWWTLRPALPRWYSFRNSKARWGISLWWVDCPQECRIEFLWVHIFQSICQILRVTCDFHLILLRRRRMWLKYNSWHSCHAVLWNPSRKDLHPMRSCSWMARRSTGLVVWIAGRGSWLCHARRDEHIARTRSGSLRRNPKYTSNCWISSSHREAALGGGHCRTWSTVSRGRRHRGIVFDCWLLYKDCV